MPPMSLGQRIRPRSGIADAALARNATTDLPHPPTHLRSLTPRTLVRLVRSPARLLEPERTIVIRLPTVRTPVPVRARIESLSRRWPSEPA